MPAPASPTTAATITRLLLKSLQNNDREAIVLHLIELGLWVGITPDPLPSPNVNVISPAALSVILDELQTTIRQHRDISARIPERDRSSVAAIIERNIEMLESVASALSGLTPTTGFLMVEG